MASSGWAGRVHNLLVAKAGSLRPLLGAYGKAWSRLSARAYRYPPGTGLEWHADADAYAGSYVLYAHRTWAPDAGGELMVAAPSGVGDFIQPRPNRLVVMAGGPLHCVARVNPKADGDRLSVSGFFLA